jgi:hypothetical protein
VTDPEIDRLIQELSRLLTEAKVYPFEPLFPDAKPHECHRNVHAFVASNDGYRAVGGWLFFDYRNAFLLGIVPTIRFTAHSLVQDENGLMLDITPSQASQRYPFIEHPFGHDDFVQLVDGRQLSHVEVEV